MAYPKPWAVDPAYTDFGEPPKDGTADRVSAPRPFCDLCGAFRTRVLRPVGKDEFGTVWRCYGCDMED